MHLLALLAFIMEIAYNGYMLYTIVGSLVIDSDEGLTSIPSPTGLLDPTYIPGTDTSIGSLDMCAPWDY